MVWDQRPCVAGCLCVFQQIAKTFQKGLIVLCISKNILTIYSSSNDMMQGSGGVYAGFSRHDDLLAWSSAYVNSYFHVRPLTHYLRLELVFIYRYWFSRKHCFPCLLFDYYPLEPVLVVPLGIVLSIVIRSALRSC